MDDREAFENTFHYFVKALHVLSSDAATQCKDMDNYNTPSEIRSDAIGRGLGSLRLSAHFLSWEQAEQIVDLVAALRQLPPEALSVPHLSMTRQVGCITAMNHPAWSPLRQQAAQLLAELRTAVERNLEYFLQQ
jgi:hypothetical protein